MMQISKKRIRKITKDGPFQGKNKVYFDNNGNPISSLDYHFKKPQQKSDISDEESELEDVNI